MHIEKESQDLNPSSNYDFESSLHQVTPKTDPNSFSQDEILSREEKSDVHAPNTKYTM